jgi:hypothetical protein
MNGYVAVEEPVENGAISPQIAGWGELFVVVNNWGMAVSGLAPGVIPSEPTVILRAAGELRGTTERFI